MASSTAPKLELPPVVRKSIQAFSLLCVKPIFRSAQKERRKDLRPRTAGGWEGVYLSRSFLGPLPERARSFPFHLDLACLPSRRSFLLSLFHLSPLFFLSPSFFHLYLFICLSLLSLSRLSLSSLSPDKIHDPTRLLPSYPGRHSPEQLITHVCIQQTYIHASRVQYSILYPPLFSERGAR